jgi:hypothetical protein
MSHDITAFLAQKEPDLGATCRAFEVTGRCAQGYVSAFSIFVFCFLCVLLFGFYFPNDTLICSVTDTNDWNIDEHITHTHTHTYTHKPNEEAERKMSV